MREPLAFFFLFLSTIGCTCFAKYEVINFLFEVEMFDTQHYVRILMFPLHGSLRDSFSDFECTGMGHTILDSPRHMEFIPVLSEFIRFRPFK